MDKIPLFPLNTVLFPGMPVMLHIFEPRYQQMIRECLEENEPFGVVLIKNGHEADGPLAEPHLVGCSARIMQAKNLTNGRMKIVAIGEQRFEVQALDHELEYLRADVEFYAMDIDDDALVQASGDHLRPLVKRYLDILNQANVVTGALNSLPDNPLDLTNLAAFLLQIPSEQKQDLLNLDLATEFIDDTLGIYLKEVALLKNLLEIDKHSTPKTASLN
ncbi:MAG: LON peptidase substrate-binding domain-containing protein [Chloroflexota bacterium]